ncbi:3'-5' exonuclease [Nocardia caishijiensis]|uniref:DNA 3'-5' helicase n=1 Tax=Nocardia caishijiensis TaxID=184756 RepID=A0ABQ6YG27_9NOCA|nr:3'-5' exonuclease [Nocardia caishijiensis]KAF0842578.1 UvrD-like helicase family protein [Nocardia caishijiensis]
MAHVIMTKTSGSADELEGAIKRRAHDFLYSVQDDEPAASTLIEEVPGATDERVRLGRIGLGHSAILFYVAPAGGEGSYVYMGAWPDVTAAELAPRAGLKVNPVNGVLELIIADTAEPAPTQQPKPAVKPGYLADLGFTTTQLTDDLGLDAKLAERVLAASDDHLINEIAAQIDGWQGDAVLELACGTSIDEIRAKLRLTENPVDPTLGEDEQILQALEHPASKIRFAYIGDNTEELRRVIEGGSFAAWRTFLHPEQRAYAEKRYNGAFRLSGGAGTGKTVVALHRARNLWRRNPNARVVLTTFNRTLARQLQADLEALDPGVRIASKPGEAGIYIDGVDKLASDVLARAGDLAPISATVLGSATTLPPRRTDTGKVWREITRTVETDLDSRLVTPGFLESEYTAVVLANKVTTVAEYAKVARAGRGVRLNRAQRIAVWKLMEAFRRRSRMDGTVSFPEVLALAAEYLRQRSAAGEFIADHVIIDEAQDLHATHWAMLRALVAEGPDDLFIAEDSHQRIFGQPVVLGRLGVKIVGRSRRLTLNYRTTAQNLRFAIDILSGGEYHDLEEAEESTHGYRSARTGPEPMLLACDSLAAELEQVAGRVRQWLDGGEEPSNIAVLTRGKNDRSQFVRALGERGIEARVLDDNPAGPGHVQVLTMHRSKGMEFAKVILAGVDDAHVPAKSVLNEAPEEERGEAELRERSLLYVAASRARDQLVVTWNGRRSELLANT